MPPTMTQRWLFPATCLSPTQHAAGSQCCSPWLLCSWALLCGHPPLALEPPGMGLSGDGQGFGCGGGGHTVRALNSSRGATARDVKRRLERPAGDLQEFTAAPPEATRGDATSRWRAGGSQDSQSTARCPGPMKGAEAAPPCQTSHAVGKPSFHYHHSTAGLVPAAATCPHAPPTSDSPRLHLLPRMARQDMEPAPAQPRLLLTGPPRLSTANTFKNLP